MTEKEVEEILWNMWKDPEVDRAYLEQRLRNIDRAIKRATAWYEVVALKKEKEKIQKRLDKLQKI